MFPMKKIVKNSTTNSSFLQITSFVQMIGVDKGIFFYHTFKVKSTELEALLQLKICTVRTNVDYHSDIMKSYTLRFVNHPPGHKVTRLQQKADTDRISKGSYKEENIFYRLVLWSILILAVVQELFVQC